LAKPESTGAAGNPGDRGKLHLQAAKQTQRTSPSAEEIRATVRSWFDDQHSLSSWIRAATFFLGKSATAKDVQGAVKAFVHLRLDAVAARYESQRGELRGYVFKAFRNFCRTEFWRLSGRRPGDRFEYVSDYETAIPIAKQYADQHEIMCALRDQEVLQNAFAELGEDQKSAFVLMGLRGMSAKEAGSMLEITPQLASVRYWRSRQQLDELLLWSRSTLGLPDITDVTGLCREIHKNMNNRTSVGGRVWALLPDWPRGLVSNAASGNSLTTSQKGQLLQGLNTVIARLDFYRAGVTETPEAVRLSKEIRGLLRRPRGPIAALRLNRLLMDGFFTNSIRSVR
jgi:RNA polymerase sigma factor (sigma-70 family)